MNRVLLTGAAAFAMTFGSFVAHAQLSCDVDDSCDGGDDTGGGLGSGPTGPVKVGGGGAPPAVTTSFTPGLATIYTTRAAFNGAAGTTVAQNFEFTPANTTVPSMGFATGSYTDANGTTFALSTLPAQPNNGVVDLNLLDSTYLPSTGSYIGAHYGSDVLSSNYSAVTFTFDHAVTAFALDFGSYGRGFTSLSDIFSFTVAGLGTQTASSNAGASAFFGFTSTVGFNSITIDTGVNTQRIYDNVAISAPAATGVVPEPATWAMFIGGFGLVGGALRRRRMTIAFV